MWLSPCQLERYFAPITVVSSHGPEHCKKGRIMENIWSIRQQGRENQAARAAEAEVKKAEAVAEAEAERRLRKKPNEARLRAMAAEDYEEQRYFHRISKASEGAAAAKQVEDDVKEIKSHLCDVFRQIKEHFKKIEDRVNQMEENMKNLRQDVQEQKLSF